MRALAHSVVAGRAGAVIACAVYAQVGTVTAGTCVAFIVVSVMLAVCVPVVQVVYVVKVNNRLVTTCGTVSVRMAFGMAVGCSGGHDSLLK